MGQIQYNLIPQMSTILSIIAQQIDESLQSGNTVNAGESLKLQYSQLGCRDKEVENYCVTRLVK